MCFTSKKKENIAANNFVVVRSFDHSLADESADAPYSIGRYAVNDASCSWIVENPHTEHKGVFQNHTEVNGYFDWAYGHNRMCSNGAKIKVNFKVPVELIREKAPRAEFIMRTRYFATWNRDPIKISVQINGETVLKQVQIQGEHLGRTTHDTKMSNLKEENSDVTITFEEGYGVLFLWDFEILVQENQEIFNLGP